jgi:2,3-bisphosphoglycerate-independent phosphoglycerate mutase
VKTCLVVMGGAADRAQPALRGGTPLQRARLPHVEEILRAGRLGLLRTTPEGADPGFETALPLLLACDPAETPPAGPLEALGNGRELRADETAFVADFVTILDGVMADPAGGRPREEEASVLRDAVNAAFGGGARLEPGSFPWRNILSLAVDGAEKTRCVAPHALGGLTVRGHGPEGPAAARIAETMQRAEATLGPHEMNAVRLDLRENPITGLWCWGGGRMGPMTPASERVGGRIVVVSGRGYPRGLAEAAGCEVADAGSHDAGAAAAALQALDGGADVAVVLLRGPEVSSLAGDPGRKVEDIERIDASVVGPLLRGLASRGEHRIAVCADVAISSTDRRALPDPVPFALAGAGVPPSRKVFAFHEEAARASDLSIDDARDFLAYVMGR